MSRTAGTLSQVRERSREPKWVARLISKCKNERYPSINPASSTGTKDLISGGKQVKHSQIPAQLGGGNLQLEDWGAGGQMPQLLGTSPEPKALCPAAAPGKRGQSPSRRSSFLVTPPKQRGSQSSARGFNSMDKWQGGKHAPNTYNRHHLWQSPTASRQRKFCQIYRFPQLFCLICGWLCNSQGKIR